VPTSPEGRIKGESENREYESSSEESVGEKNNRDKRDTGESIDEEEKGVEVNIGNCVTDEEEDGTVTVLKLSNGVMFRVPVEVQGLTVPPDRPPIPYLPLGAYPANSSPFLLL
jgi:hypothetical protein